MLSLYLSLYMLVISILFDATAFPSFKEKSKPNQTPLAIMRSYNLEYGTLKSDLDSDQGSPYEPHCAQHPVCK